MNRLRILLLPIFILSTGCAADVPETPERKVIQTDRAPAAVGVYSQAIQMGNVLYVSGQIGLIPGSRSLAGDDLESQTHQTLKNIEAVLEAAGFSLADVVQAQVFLDDMEEYAAFNTIYVQYFPENPPARAVVEASRIPLDAKVEIMVTAVKY